MVLLAMVIKDCKEHERWDLEDEGNWAAMEKNLMKVKNWIKEDVSYKNVWEIKHVER